METLEAAVKTAQDEPDFDEDNVLDCTLPAKENMIHLKNALDINKLLNEEGVDLIPEIDEGLTDDVTGQNNQDFFQRLRNEDEETIAKAVDGLDLNLEDFDEAADELSFNDLGTKMDNVTGDGKVKKKVIRPGLDLEGLVPDRGTVTIHYKMFVEGQDETFDSTWLRGKPERFQLDDGQMLPGMELSLKSMKKKERSRFLIDPVYGYGAMGCPPRIPGNAQIMAEIEMLDFVNEGKADAMLAMMAQERSKKHSYDEIEKICAHEHKEGNVLCKKGEYKLAARRFERAIKLLEDIELQNDGEEKRQQRLLLKLTLNIGHCYIKFQWFKKACLALQRALEIEPGHPKALYRMGKAKAALANYDEARRFFIKAQNVSDDPAIGKELANLDRIIKTDQDNQRALCRRMFGGDGSGSHRMAAEVQAHDEDYEEIYQQLKHFKEDTSQQQLVLPEGMSSADIRVAQVVVSKMKGLQLVPATTTGNRRQWVVKRV